MVTIAKFREDAGVMMPGIWCKGHDLEGRVIYDMNDVDPEQNEASTAVFRTATIANNTDCSADLHGLIQGYPSRRIFRATA